MTKPEKVKPMHADRWGLFYKIKSEERARYAVMMSGLPIFMEGVFGLIMFLIVALNVWPNFEPMDFAIVGMSIVLVVIGLKIRSGSINLAPIAAIFYIAVWIAIFVTQGFILSIIGLLFILLSLTGLYGWWWLRKNAGLKFFGRDS
ncbi:MAG: hypothetical protein HKN36_12780 [Hellea sp.]|nr:hypothetical protein [Hellea sp.]